MQIEELIRVAKGDIPADLVILNGDIVNVYSGELLERVSIAIRGKRIAYMGKEIEHTIGPDTHVIDADGMILIPGLIDAHTHMLMYSPLHEVIRYAVKGGTTTIISEAIELSFPYGMSGIADFLEWIKAQPIKIYATVPAMHCISSSGKRKAIDIKAFKNLLMKENVLGMGETIWSYVTKMDKRILDLINETLSYGKLVEGHGAGAKGRSLCSFVASGISSCHESISLNEVLERLRLGLYTMIREGDIRRELKAISKIKDMEVDLRRLILVSDGLAPNTLISYGYMEYILQKAIDLGFDPIKAIQMVTLNPAEHFRLDHLIGGIAPYRYADIVIIPSLREIRPRYVISSGHIVAKDGKVLIEPRIPNYRKDVFPSINIPRRVTPSDFIISYRSMKKGSLKVRVIDLATPLVTREKVIELTTQDGQLLGNIDNDILKVAAITGADNKVNKFVGFIKGFGLRKGAFATSAVWDACLIVVVGADEKDMALAVNRVMEMGGGIAVCKDERVIAELSMPIGGIIADMPMNEIARHMEHIQKSVESLGCKLPDAHLTLSTLTTPYIPFLRISEDGLFDLKEARLVPLIEN